MQSPKELYSALEAFAFAALAALFFFLCWKS